MGFCLLLKAWTKINGKNISKSLSGKYSQKLIDHVKQSATDATEVSKISPQNNF